LDFKYAKQRQSVEVIRLRVEYQPVGLLRFREATFTVGFRGLLDGLGYIWLGPGRLLI